MIYKPQYNLTYGKSLFPDTEWAYAFMQYETSAQLLFETTWSHPLIHHLNLLNYHLKLQDCILITAQPYYNAVSRLQSISNMDLSLTRELKIWGSFVILNFDIYTKQCSILWQGTLSISKFVRTNCWRIGGVAGDLRIWRHRCNGVSDFRCDLVSVNGFCLLVSHQ